MVGEPFLFGVNYWPRSKAMAWWADFDPREVREDFAMIRELGLGYVRVFLLWESFQPQPDDVDRSAIDHLRIVADIAAELGLGLEPTFFTGHMSGPNWAPDWLLDGTRARRPGGRQLVGLAGPHPPAFDILDPYAEPFVLEAQRRLLLAVCAALVDHPGVWAWSLGNEPDLFAHPESADAGRAWIADTVQTIRSIDADRPILIGLHGASLHADVGLRVDHAAAETDISVMHGYSIYDSLSREPLDPMLVPFTAALTAALAGRPILFEEFGVSTRIPDGPSRWVDLPTWDGGSRRAFLSSEADAAHHYAAVLDGLLRTGSIGAFAWCFGDYAEPLWDRPPCDLQAHERSFGLFRADGTLKPMGAVLGDLARSQPAVRAPELSIELPMGADAFYRDPERYLPRLYATFLASADPGR